MAGSALMMMMMMMNSRARAKVIQIDAICKCVANDEEWWPIDRILDERTTSRGRGKKRAVQYLCRFTGWGPDWDEWIDERNVTEVAVREWRRRSRTSAN